MSELANEGTNMSRVSLPGRLWGALIVLAFQVLANGFLGWLVIDGLNEDASHGASSDGAGLAYFLGYLSIALAVVLLVCVVFSFRPQSWVRPIVITVESIAIVNGVVILVNGSVAGLLGIVLAIAVIAVLMNDDVRDWYQHGRVEG
jgi:hypothetical protein